MKANVKVMLSYDYCHFEVSLGSDDNESLNIKDVNNLRKIAQRLANEAVRQYKESKQKANMQYQLDSERLNLEKQVEIIREKVPSERTAEEMAKMKALEDKAYWSRHRYDYDDDDECYR